VLKSPPIANLQNVTCNFIEKPIKMNILIFSIFLNIIIIVINYFSSQKKINSLKIITYFGIFIGITFLIFNFLFKSCFGASTPIDIKTENLTKQKLKIYGIAFFEDYGNGHYVEYNAELKPNETSEFCLDSDGGKFWIVAKNTENEIVYLEETENKKTNFKIIANQNNKLKESEIAKKLTFKEDKSVEFEKYLVWANIVLIILLVLNCCKKQKK
jgi:hypothetical protein